MLILDLLDGFPSAFDFTQQPETYDFETPAQLVELLRLPTTQSMLELSAVTGELEYYAAGGAVTGKKRVKYLSPLRERVTLHPRLVDLCMRCEGLPRLPHVAVFRDHLLRHLEAEVLRRKLRALLA